ncbi:MAG: PIN domain-containing protein [Vicinamibacterales bacterium]|nr:PIN domain-containing protein [Vicinamibacterales bacterium]
MSARCFVDTNILVYAHDRSSGVKRERARAIVDRLWSEQSGILSTQVLQEFCVNARRRAERPVSTDELRDILTPYFAWDVIVNTPASVLEALSLERRYQIPFWDALIIRAAQAAGATILYTEDLSDGQIYGSVRVVNPLREGPAEAGPHV